MKIYLYNSDYNEQSIRQMETVITYLNAEQIVTDVMWEKHIKNFTDTNCIFEEGIEDFLMKNKASKTCLVFFNIIDGIRIIRKTYKFNVKLVFRPRGILPEESYYKNKNRAKTIALNLIERFVISKIDSIIYLSEVQKNFYEKKYKRLQNKKIVKAILPNIKKTAKIHEDNILAYKNSIVYSGGFSKWQNIDLIFKLVSEIILDLNVNCVFTVLTFEKNFQNARELAEKYSIKEYVNLKYVSPNELDKELLKHNIGVIIRDNDVVNTTSSPFKVIDYISNGLAVILTDNISWQAKQILNKDSYYELKYSVEEINYNSTELKDFIIRNFENGLKKEKIDRYEHYINSIGKIVP
ncbi:MAG: hypothetical protein NUK57_02440 [Gudongella sp.]|nr:hypothetical protein [Gudongella sp.]